jgi:hypothetical protein
MIRARRTLTVTANTRFGMLVTKTATLDRKWICICDCGNWTIVQIGNLFTGNTKSCGCLRKTWGMVNNITHGHSAGGKPSRTYRSWCEMIARCSSPHRKDWLNYGGRGITVCERWSDFANFLEDMGERPDGKTLNRVDNNVGYEPGNCAWATWFEQNQNRRDTIYVTICSKPIALIQACRDYEVSYKAIHRRMHKRAMSAIESFLIALERKIML